MVSVSKVGWEFEFKECKIRFFYFLTIRLALPSKKPFLFKFIAPSSYEKQCRSLERLFLEFADIFDVPLIIT